MNSQVQCLAVFEGRDFFCGPPAAAQIKVMTKRGEQKGWSVHFCDALIKIPIALALPRDQKQENSLDQEPNEPIIRHALIALQTLLHRGETKCLGSKMINMAEKDFFIKERKPALERVVMRRRCTARRPRLLELSRHPRFANEYWAQSINPLSHPK